MTRRDDIRAYLLDPFSFIQRLRIVGRDNKPMFLSPLGKAQADVIASIAQRPDVIILKDRKRGISTGTLAALFWWMFISPDEESLVTVTHANDATTSMNQVLSRFVEGLPPPVQPVDIDITADHVSFRASPFVRDLLGHPASAPARSVFQQRTAGGRSQGRSFTFSHTHFTEAAYYPEGSSAVSGATNQDGADFVSYASWRNSVPDHARRRNAVESTANGPYGLYATLWRKAQDNPGDWASHFFPWFFDDLYTKRPGSKFELTPDEKDLLRTHAHAGLTVEHIAWRRWKLGQGTSEAAFRKEFPSTPDEPFLLSGNGYFDGEILNKLAGFTDKLRCPPGEELVILERQLPGRRYAIGADTCAGVGADFCYFSVLRDDGKQVARYRSNTASPTQQGDMLARLSTMYGRAKVLVESNNHGKAVLKRCVELGLNLWVDEQGKPFWTQRGAAGNTKPLVLANARDLLTEGFFFPPMAKEPWIADPVVITELISMKDDGTGNVRAPGDQHDDSAMGWILSLWCARDIFRGTKRGLPEPAPLKRLDELAKMWR